MPHIETPVLVIGAGPAGLATAASLLDRGVHLQVIERGSAVGTSWHGHYQRLHLHTVKEHSALPLRGFPTHFPRYVAREQLLHYLADYADHFGIAPHFGEEAVAIRRLADGRWQTECRRGLRFVSPAVVLATGANSVPHEPALAGQDRFQGTMMHSLSYREPTPFLGRRVLVVGMGNTGAEIALDLAQADVPVALSVRSPVNIVRRDVLGRPTQLTSILLSRLPRPVAFAVAARLRDWTVGDLRAFGLATPRASPLQQLVEEGRTPVIDVGTLALIRQGRIAVRAGIERLTAGGARFTDGREEPFDVVILATGYRPDVQRLFPGLQLSLDGRELPTQVTGAGPLAGLHFVGFDIRQPGGLLRTIAMQAQEVAAAIAPSRTLSTAH